VLAVAVLLLGVEVFRSHELYDIDPAERVRAASAAGLGSPAFRYSLTRAKLRAYEITEGRLLVARRFLYAQIAVGLVSVVLGSWLLGR
jgi:hypothetical protein